MYTILTETHKLIGTKVYEHINNSYGIELNYDKLVWGSTAPDILPKYKLYRHYYENSIDYIILRIAKLIIINRFLDFTNCNYIDLKSFSRDIGIISHYLSDFTCLAHADRWTFLKSLIKHVKYENELNEYSKNHVFEMGVIKTEDIEIDENLFNMLPKIKHYIESVVNEYLEDESFDRDLNYALNINFKIFEFIIESILVYNGNLELQYNI